MADCDYTVKIILLGDYSVKKDMLLKALRLLPPEPEVTYLTSRAGIVELLFLRDGRRVRAKIYDTAGQERFRSITSSFFRGAQGCLLLFDITRKDTFENVNLWHEELRTNTPQEDVVITLAGCNCHVAGSQRQVVKKSAQALADYLNVPYEEMSVQIVSSVIRVLQSLVDRIILKASMYPGFSDSIVPLDSRLDKLHNKRKGRKSNICAC